MTTFTTNRVTPPAPPPSVVVHHGVAIGAQGGAIVSARWEHDLRPSVIGFERFGASLVAIGERVRQLLEDDAGCMVTIDTGLHGLDLKSYLDDLHVSRRRLSYFEVGRPELRRWELAGRLRATYDKGGFGIKRLGAGSLALRAAVADATREDASDRVEVVALSLAVVNRRQNPPRIG